ncbi:hypothetical protein ACEZ3G_02420 [Maribacter algicola]|uniref:Uncharacterized protein n=1 Tax=Meishania litoralis TaxID=3434685 RepID=A0ACC7LFT0_9FLAO
MAERLVIVSDMWGTKKGLWITSYLGYLQQYYDITFYDSQQLANIDLKINTAENIHHEFVNGGIETAASHLLKRESEPCHYLAFSTGGTIVWKAGLMGLPMKSLYSISATRIRKENEKPDALVTLVYGANDKYRPTENWAKKVGVDLDIVENFGHTLYSDEKIIQKVCLELLANVTQKEKKKKVV